ncbi:hypothetical protein GON26_06555 [Flavobacterium sp. GA093]|uniref:Uncharacterized protein n=1 Tax=Flavobacterium hydrocarbonoxydans TaxID=2683249 RepID=A0A6I4NHR5_9FLAO|nr:hypothetical protein [Flavobacterium hydrocarbonoxydans]MWB94016.1 hypothetical protein [Flavobacterium hydrocarbonoxydans]
MTINEFIGKYKSDNFSSYIKENATIDYWNDLIKTYKLEKLNFTSIELLALSLNSELLENGNLLGVRFDGFCERQIKKIEIENQYQPKQNEKKVKSLGMIEKLHIGFKDIHNEKIYKLDLSEEQKKALGLNNNKSDKSIWDYFDAYLSDKKLKEHLITEFQKSIDKTLPKAVKESCLYCTGNDKTIKQEDKKCYNYLVEGQMNEFFAVWWFVNIVENNKQLLFEKEALKKLSVKLYECFLFKDGRVFFDLKKLTMYCLEQGFLTLSNIFAKNDKIHSLEIINRAIDDLDSEYLSITMFDKGKPYHIEPQKMFLKSKRKSIKEQLKIDRLKNKQTPPQQTEPLFNNEAKKELHNHIFKDNAFVVWERLFENFNINETKRTDLRFMYEIMKYKEQIHKTVTVKNITDWINDTYQFSIEKLQYTNIKNKSNESRMSIYNLIK